MVERSVRKLSFPAVAQCCFHCRKDNVLVGELDSLAEWLGYPSEELVGKRLCDILSRDGRDESLHTFGIQLERKVQTDILLSFCKKNGENVWALACCRKENESSEIVDCVMVLADDTGAALGTMQETIESYADRLTQIERVIGTLKIRSSQDSLTKLLNSASTRSAAEEYLSGGDKICAVLVIDIDDFKQINDTYGHIVGDDVLVSAADTIKRLFRSNDIVGRVGGDEFLVLMKDIKESSIVNIRCEQLVRAFCAIDIQETGDAGIHCSVGAALCPAHGSDYKNLFSVADKAMYCAKNSGGNKYIIEEI